MLQALKLLPVAHIVVEFHVDSTLTFGAKGKCCQRTMLGSGFLDNKTLRPVYKGMGGWVTEFLAFSKK